MEKNVPLSAVYDQVVKPFLTTTRYDFEKYDHFEESISRLDQGILEKFLKRSQLTVVVEQLTQNFPHKSPAWSFFGDDHCRCLVELTEKEQDLAVAYIRYWNFTWEVYGRDYTFFREAAWPNDCVAVSISEQKYFLGPFAAMALVQAMAGGQESKKLQQVLEQIQVLSKSSQNWLALRLMVIGIMALYFNTQSSAGCSHHPGFEPLTGRRTGYYSRGDSLTVSGQEKVKMVQAELQRMKTERQTISIIHV